MTYTVTSPTSATPTRPAVTITDTLPDSVDHRRHADRPRTASPAPTTAPPTVATSPAPIRPTATPRPRGRGVHDDHHPGDGEQRRRHGVHEHRVGADRRPRSMPGTCPGTCENETAANNDNNSDSVTTSVGGSAIDLIMGDITDMFDPSSVSDSLTYTVTVTNGGSQDALAADGNERRDPRRTCRPVGVTFNSGIASQGFVCVATNSDALATCTGDLDAGESTTLTIDVHGRRGPAAEADRADRRSTRTTRSSRPTRPTTGLRGHDGRLGRLQHLHRPRDGPDLRGSEPGGRRRRRSPTPSP